MRGECVGVFMDLERSFAIRLSTFNFTLGIYKTHAFWSSTMLKHMETYHSRSNAPPHQG